MIFIWNSYFEVNSTALNDSSILADRNNYTQIYLSNIESRKQEALEDLRKKYFIRDIIGYSGGVTVAVFVVLFICWIVMFDTLNLLSYCGIMKPIKSLGTAKDLNNKKKSTKGKPKTKKIASDPHLSKKAIMFPKQLKSIKLHRVVILYNHESMYENKA